MKNTEKDLWYATPTHIPLLGHRGNRAQYPENTLVSFASAIDMGVDLIEFDVNLTKDEELVVIHDNSIDRTSDHTGLTRDYTLQELKSFDFGSWFGEKFRGTQIPTLFCGKRMGTHLLSVRYCAALTPYLALKLRPKLERLSYPVRFAILLMLYSVFLR